jgi:iron complex outermembrane recepter protein
MRTVVLLLLMVVLWDPTSTHAQTLNGVVHDSRHELLPGAHVVVEGARMGTVTDDDGRFVLMLDSGRHTIVVTMLGYRLGRYEVVLQHGETLEFHVVLQPAIVGMKDEIIVHSDRGRHGWSHEVNHGMVSTERLIEEADGVAMIRRANYGWDPVIRGASDGRVSIRIDNMVMVPACVDRMDPVTSYVDTGNLERLEIARGGFDLQNASRPGGQINLVTRAAERNRLAASIESEYQGAARGQVHRATANVGGERWGVRLNASHRRAGDYRAGGGWLVERSGFQKSNWKAEALYEISATHQSRLTVIGDIATDIGYPGLLMDTDRAESHLIGIEHRWRPAPTSIPEVRLRLYHTRVDHHMSDYERDVATRRVMPNMYMPMYGKTRTTGIRGETSFIRGHHLTQFSVEGYVLGAFADMHMEPTASGIAPMYLLNVGGVRFVDAAVAVDHTWNPVPTVSLGAGIRADVSDRTLTKEDGRRSMEALHPGVPLDRVGRAASVALRAAAEPLRHVRVHLHGSRSTRLPTHLEAYGFYIYQPVDGFFHHGSPGLRSEKSWQMEAGIDIDTPVGGMHANAFANWYGDYIAPVQMDELFKHYQNVASARTYGFEASYSSIRLAGFSIDAATSYVVGQNSSFDEPLPMIPPLEASVMLSYRADGKRIDLRSRHVASQRRVASRTTSEAPTRAFHLLDVRSSFTLTGAVTLRMGIENVLDRQYREHLNVSQIPSPGRNVYVGVGVTI